MLAVRRKKGRSECDNPITNDGERHFTGEPCSSGLYDRKTFDKFIQ